MESIKMGDFLKVIILFIFFNELVRGYPHHLFEFDNKVAGRSEAGHVCDSIDREIGVFQKIYGAGHFFFGDIFLYRHPKTLFERSAEIIIGKTERIGD